MMSLVEARLQTCTHRLLDTGIDVVPDGNNSYEMFCFAVPQAETSSSALFNSIFKQLTDELLATHEQKPVAFIEVHANFQEQFRVDEYYNASFLIYCQTRYINVYINVYVHV